MHNDLKGHIKLKVCGMRAEKNILDLAVLQPDYMGFIFYAPSNRFADKLDINTLNKIPVSTKKTGVFVNADLGEIIQKIKTYNLDAVQLHGNESSEFCKQVKILGIEVIKAFGVDESFNFDVLEKYQSFVDYFLFDTKTKLHGGSGLTFNWNLLEGYRLNTPYFLSGGLDTDNIQEALKIEDSRFYALDLNSRFEISPGLKNIEQLKIVINKIRKPSISGKI